MLTEFSTYVLVRCHRILMIFLLFFFSLQAVDPALTRTLLPEVSLIVLGEYGKSFKDILIVLAMKLYFLKYRLKVFLVFIMHLS